jgi:hypothetical protein
VLSLGLAKGILKLDLHTLGGLQYSRRFVLRLSDPSDWRLAGALLRRTAAARLGAGGESMGDEVRSQEYNGQPFALADWRAVASQPASSRRRGAQGAAAS